MTTPIDSTSPFIGSTSAVKDPKETSTNAEEFSIHTMQDDLLSLGKSAPSTGVPTLAKTSVPAVPPEKKLPIENNAYKKPIFQPLPEKKITPVSTSFSLPPQQKQNVFAISPSKKSQPQPNNAPAKISFLDRFNIFGKKVTKEEKLAA